MPDGFHPVPLAEPNPPRAAAPIAQGSSNLSQPSSQDSLISSAMIRAAQAAHPAERAARGDLPPLAWSWPVRLAWLTGRTAEGLLPRPNRAEGWVHLLAQPQTPSTGPAGPEAAEVVHVTMDDLPEGRIDGARLEHSAEALWHTPARAHPAPLLHALQQTAGCRSAELWTPTEGSRAETPPAFALSLLAASRPDAARTLLISHPLSQLLLEGHGPITAPAARMADLLPGWPPLVEGWLTLLPLDTPTAPGRLLTLLWPDRPDQARLSAVRLVVSPRNLPDPPAPGPTEPGTAAAQPAAEPTGQPLERLLADSLADMLSRHALGDGRILYVSPSCQPMLGWKPDDLVGRIAFDFHHPDDREQTQRAMARLLRGETDLRIEYRFRHSNGGYRWLETIIRVLRDPTGRASEIICVSRDVTERRRLESQLRQREAFIRKATQAIPCLVFVVDVIRDVVVYVNSRAEEMLGYRVQQLLTMPQGSIRELLHPDDRQRCAESGDWRTLPPDFAGTIERDLRLKTRHRGYRWFRTRETIFQRDAGGNIWLIIGAATDITDERHSLHSLQTREQRYREMAYVDQLTQLPNRVALQDELAELMPRQDPENPPFALLYLDLDGFKLINDRFGHRAGDHVLKAVGDRLRRAVRPGQKPFRLGGDEFAVLIDLQRPGEDPYELATRLLVDLARPIRLEHSQRSSLHASVGIVFGNGQQARAEDLLHDADVAMYAAKRSGGARAVHFDEAGSSSSNSDPPSGSGDMPAFDAGAEQSQPDWPGKPPQG